MKKSFAIDYSCLLAVLCTFAFGVLTAVGIKEGDKLGDVLSAVTIGGILTLFFAVGIVITPKLYVADQEGMSIYYLPFIKDYYKWEDIKRINVMYRRRLRTYNFERKKHAESDAKIRFFKNSEFPKTFMLKKLINKYWQGEVEGDDWENFKKKLRSWKSKHKVVLDVSEAEKAEREARGKIREIIKANKPLAEASGKFVKAVYTYESEYKTLTSRPKGSYSYNVEIEISEIGSSEDERLYVMTEVLFVRYGKKDIKVITDEAVYDKISELLIEAIEK